MSPFRHCVCFSIDPGICLSVGVSSQWVSPSVGVCLTNHLHSMVFPQVGDHWTEISLSHLQEKMKTLEVYRYNWGYRGFAWQPCWMAGTKKFVCMKIDFISQKRGIVLFLPSNMAVVQTLYCHRNSANNIKVRRIRNRQCVYFYLRRTYIEIMESGHRFSKF